MTESGESAAAIFFSYAREDAAFIDEVKRLVEAAGHDVWVDVEDIRGGDSWRSAIVAAISGADAVVVALSRHSVQSRNVATEVSIAASQQVRIVPLRLDETEPEGDLAYDLARVHWVDGPDPHTAAAGLLDALRPGSGDQVRAEAPRRPRRDSKSVPWWALAGAGAAVIAAVALGMFLNGGRRDAPPSSAVLNWLDAATEDVVDGSVLKPGTRLELEERFPGTPPTRFSVLEDLDPLLQSVVPREVAAFAVTREGAFTVRSDRAFRLPQPAASKGQAHFVFRDDAGNESARVSSAGLATTAAEVQPGAAEIQPGVFSVGTGVAAEVAFSFPADPDVDVIVLVPWGDGDASLPGYLDGYLIEIAEARGANPDELFAEYSEAYGDLMPRERPEGWDIFPSVTSFSADEGDTVAVEIEVTAAVPAGAVFAVKIVDRNDPSRIAVSDLIGIVIPEDRVVTTTTEGPRRDAAPVIAQLRVPDEPQFMDGFDERRDQWFKVVGLGAIVNDDEDGTLDGDAIVWSTNRDDLQEPIIGFGRSVEVVLYSFDCVGATHVLTVTATDTAGNASSARFEVELTNLC